MKILKTIIIGLMSLSLVACSNNTATTTTTPTPTPTPTSETRIIEVKASFEATIDDIIVNKDTNEKTLAIVSQFQSPSFFVDLAGIDLSEVNIGDRYLFKTNKMRVETTLDEDEIKLFDDPVIYLEFFDLKVTSIEPSTNTGFTSNDLEVEFLN